MDLFEQLENSPGNLLPYQGTVNYYGPIMSRNEADSYFDCLMHEIQWQHDEAIIFGKRIVTKRKVAWYADWPAHYTYSNTTKTALPWAPVLLALKNLVQTVSGETYNACLLNLYHDGSEGMAWHSDAEKDLKPNGAIGSLIFGAERKFALKHKQSKETVTKILQHGSLLVMKGATQTHWVHRLPTTKTKVSPRINLTFRTMKNST
jgi:alkylated DNA repair dioxygenase AlkB